jgi:CheY-like chemotaxis protein
MFIEGHIRVNNKRLLLVGDNDDVRAVFQEGLEAYGFEVVPATSVNEALRFISTEKFDILLSDLHMPDAGGWIFRRQRHAPRTSERSNTSTQQLPCGSRGYGCHPTGA